MHATRPGCPSDEEVARFLEAALSGEEHARMQAHLDECEVCRALVAGSSPTGASQQSLVDADTLPAWAESRRLARGTLIGRYVVLDFLGAGGMGSVYSAFDPELDRRVALKLLRTDKRNAEHRGLLLREAQVLARCSHPHVATVYDAGTFEEQVFLAMELIEGGTLRDWLAAEARPWRAVVGLLAAAGDGLAAAHRAGLVHRDFKPENVLVGRDGRARVTDFGLAGPTEYGARKIMGTPAYMAPEQIAGEPCDARADLFSFCVTLYEALYGARPFAGETLSAIRDAMRAGSVRAPPRERRVPAWLHQMIVRGLRADPSARPASMDVLLSALRADPALRRRRFFAAASLVVVATVVGVLGQRAISARAASCAGAASLLDGAWDPARREAVQAAFARSGLPYSATSFAGAAHLLDQYAQAWSAMRTEACEATRVRRAQPEETMALRVACLDDRRRELRALTDVFVTADRATIDHAATAASMLTPVSVCSDVAALAAPVPRPRDPVGRARLEAALAKVSQAEALVRAFKPEEAAPLAESALTEMRAIGHAPSEAYAAEIVADVWFRQGKMDQAIGASEEALYAGQRGHDDRQVLSALEALTQQVGVQAGRPEEGLRYARLALATIERTGNDPRDLVVLKAVRSGVLGAAGRLDEAVAERREVLAAWEQMYGADNVEVIETRSNLGVLLSSQGRMEEARAQFAAAVSALERLLGAGNPETLPARNNLGLALLLLGRTAEAAPILESVSEDERRRFGEQSLTFGFALASVGELRLAQGRFADALDLERRAVAVIERLGPDNAELSEPLAQVGQALLGLGRASEALAPLERALSIGKAHRVPSTDLARVQFALARALAAAHRDLPRARALVASARQVFLDAARRWGGENSRFADELSAGLDRL